ncbi:unnamed protein product [Vitrella brassicaformis CCMP3155]|uniref:Uncharacterized protein n=1 Tax=Vitrella brassicaformis (strain CCMP3155) TaxID=1169540 RepID=A0A0G4EKZ9_VITBC|nr:unnamed protein product [Vitrella brassicaformis CCMP3155]|eukprot:CEL98075.1 unnamed protein product [Vitrella brassicaformis CCMP3155]
MSAAAPASDQQQQQQQTYVIENVEVRFPPGSNAPTKRLVRSTMRRTITPDGVRRLIRRGADPRVVVELLWPRGPAGRHVLDVCVLSLAIDDSSRLSALEDALDIWVFPDAAQLVLPLWPSRARQEAVLIQLIRAGARVDGPPGAPTDVMNLGTGDDEKRTSHCPIQMAVRAANLTAVKVLTANGVGMRGLTLLFVPGKVRPNDEYEAALMAVYTHLVQHDPCLATELGPWSYNVIHRAVMNGKGYSDGFTLAFLQLMKDNGASVTHRHQFDSLGLGGADATPLHEAAQYRAYPAIEWLCPYLTPADINASSSANKTPLGLAGGQLANLVGHPLPSERRDETISGMKGAVRTLLLSGAAIDMVPTATDSDRHDRRLVDEEYVQLLDQLADDVMDAVNGALNPQRDVANLLTRLLPLARPKPSDSTDDAPAVPSRPSPFAHSNETPQIAWKVGAFFHEPEAVDQMRLTTHTPLAGRIKAAMQHFVKCAATKTAGNREVVGVMANVGGRVVRVPLQCFAVNRGQHAHRRLGLREVVQKARLDEAARFGLTGVVKGFNTHLGNEECQFEWQQLGWVDETGRFQPLGIS